MGSPLRPPALPTTTRGPPSPPGRFKRLSDSSSPESWLSTPSRKEPRPSPSTPAPSKWCARVWLFSTAPRHNNHPKSPFQGCHTLPKDCHYIAFNLKYILCIEQMKKKRDEKKS